METLKASSHAVKGAPSPHRPRRNNRLDPKDDRLPPRRHHRFHNHPPTTQKAIGKIGVWQEAEIGFLLSRQYWGKGLAREALSINLGYLFRERDMQEITADVDPRNERSIKGLEGMWFVRTGFEEKTFEIGGEWVDGLYLGLRREVWEGRIRREER